METVKVKKENQNDDNEANDNREIQTVSIMVVDYQNFNGKNIVNSAIPIIEIIVLCYEY